MALSHDELLGFSLLLWTAAGLLTLYLLCNPGAAAVYAWLGPTRSWGTVLGLASLGTALPTRRPLFWSLLATPLAMIVLPPPLARPIGWTAFVGGTALAGLALFRRWRRAQMGARRRMSRIRRPRASRRPARHLRRGRAADSSRQSKQDMSVEGG